MAFGSYGTGSPAVNNSGHDTGALSAWPDLMALINRYDGYDRITTEAWNDFDDAVARHRAAQIARLRQEQQRNLQAFLAPVRKPAKARRAPR